MNTVNKIRQLLISGFDNWRSLGNIYTRETDNLILFSYAPRAAWSAEWNEYELVSRGLILNRDTGEVVARPFDKFFNWGEGGRTGSGNIKTVTVKEDGSLGALLRHNGYRIATRGSFDGEQVLWATNFLRNYDLTGLPNELTLLFEIIYPENRIVVDYGDREDLVLLAARNRFNGQYLDFKSQLLPLAAQYGLNAPETYSFDSIGDILTALKGLDSNSEGWVVEMTDGSRWKFKGEQYLALHRMISSLSFKNTLEAMRDGKMAELMSPVPDEVLTEVRSWETQITDTIRDTSEIVRCIYETAPKNSRKEFALFVRDNAPDYAPYLFALYDGKDIDGLIYRLAF